MHYPISVAVAATSQYKISLTKNVVVTRCISVTKDYGMHYITRLVACDLDYGLTNRLELLFGTII